MVGLALVFVVALLAAPLTAAAGAAVPSAPEATVRCAWPFITDPAQGQGNVAAPDEYATYWTTPIVYRGKATTITLEGFFPEARFMALQTYSAGGTGVDGIADFELPATAGGNPYADPNADPTARNRFALTIKPTAPIADGDAVLRGLPATNTSGFGLGWIIYRVYVGQDGDNAGERPLPRLTIKQPGQAPVELRTCQRSQLHGGLIERFPLRGGSAGGSGLPTGDLPWIRSSASNSAHLFPNKYNAYIGLNAQGAYESDYLLIVRGKAPTFPDTLNGERVTTPGKDVRYWSLSSNDYSGAKPVIQTRADFEAQLDGQDFYSFVINRAADKPPAATLNRWGAVWLDWGNQNDNLVAILRNMLPNDAFGLAIQNIPQQNADGSAVTDAQIRQVMGAYYPRARFCETAVFEAGGAAACFAG